MKKINLCLFLVILLTGCFGELIRSDWDLWRYKDITKLKIAEVLTADGNIASSGVVVPYDGKYLIGLKHCFVQHVCHPFSGYFAREIEDPSYRIDGIQITKYGELDDIIVFNYPEELKYDYPCKWGSVNDLRVGDRILSVGYTALKAVNVRDGVVSTLSFNGDKEKFVASIGGFSGDSGSPVLYMRYGNLYIAGLTQGGIRGADYSIVVGAEKIRRFFIQLADNVSQSRSCS